MKEDLNLWAEDQARLQELALEALVSGRTTFISPFTGARKSALDIFGLKRRDSSSVIKAGVLPGGPLSSMHGWTREGLLRELVDRNPFLGRFPGFFVLSEGDRLEVFRVGELGSPERVFKRKIKRK